MFDSLIGKISGEKQAKGKVCPRCKSNRVVYILYGEPSSQGCELEKKGELVLGGCISDKNSPINYCKNCKNEW